MPLCRLLLLSSRHRRLTLRSPFQLLLQTGSECKKDDDDSIFFSSHSTTFFSSSSSRSCLVFPQQQRQKPKQCQELDDKFLPHHQSQQFLLLHSAKFSTQSSSGQKEELKTTHQLSWIELYMPKLFHPYALLARLDKPIGTWLLAWPCMWSITMAASPGHLPDFKMLALFGCGSVLLRGAGCTVNDLLDRDIDKKLPLPMVEAYFSERLCVGVVRGTAPTRREHMLFRNWVERTKSRPLASHLLTSFQGLTFLGFQLLLGLGILLQLNNYSRILGASSLLLVFIYPLMKRITFWPQAFLGLTFNWGALLGWAAIKGSLDPTVILPLYTSGVFWTLVYDTIYAHQDTKDDLKVGVKSTALRFGSQTKYWISTFGVLCISNLALSGYNTDLAWPYYGFLSAAAGQLGWQIWTVDLANRADCNRKFVSNKWFGALIFCGVFFGRLASPC